MFSIHIGMDVIQITFRFKKLAITDYGTSHDLTTKLGDRRRKRPAGCNNRRQITWTVRLPIGAAVRCSALVSPFPNAG